jgi:hypothetical protein
LKIKGIIAVLFVVFAFESYGQSANMFGFKGGLNVSTLGQQGAGFTSKLGYNLGFYSEKRFYQELGVQMELLLSLQGARIETISDLKLNYTYLTVPLIAKIYFIESASIEAGLQPGYLLRAIQADDGDKYSIRDDVNSFDFSGIIGLNYSKPYGSIGIRYVLGINNTTSASRSSEVKYKNKVLQLYISKTLIDSE